MLEKIEVKCKGCGTNVFLDQVEAHVKGSTEIEVQCTLSKEIMRRREKEADKETRAQEDIVCACGIRFKRAEASHECYTCSLKEIECPLTCGESTKR